MQNPKLLAAYASLFIWGSLYLGFVFAAFVLRSYMQKSCAAESWGWDYQTFVGQIQDWRWIGYFGFRHPGLGLVCSPLVVLEHVWSGAYLFVMPAVATLTAWFIWKLSNWLGLVAWLSFPTTWLMAGIPESFPIAQLALVASVWAGVRREEEGVSEACRGERGEGVRYLMVVGFTCLNGMITLTNGVKPLLGCLVLNWRRLDRKVLKYGGLAVFGCVLMGIVFFTVRSVVIGRGIEDGLAATLSWIPAQRNLPHELYGFFIRPVGLYQSFIVYPLAIFGISKSIRIRHTSSLILLASYFIVDVCIHNIIGWGMTEPWVFAPHWIWMLPLLVAKVRTETMIASSGR